MKVLSVVGTRPEFVMAFPVERRLRQDHDCVLVHTGQHYDPELSAVFVSELGLAEPEYDLGGATESAPLRWKALLRDLRNVVEDESPDVVLAYGDTNSTLAGAVAAVGADAPLAHVEAGLRSGDPAMAEERNRILVDHLADLRFAPTDHAVDNLHAEGLDGRAHLVGDLLEDAVGAIGPVARERSDVLSRYDLEPGAYVVATVHRAENTDDPVRLGSIVEGLAASPRPVVLPLHPRTADRLREHGLYEAATDALELIEPQGYLDFIRLLDAAERVATDSGGVQKEASYLGTPCLTLREETEWPETIARGHNQLVGADATTIRRALRRTPEGPAASGSDEGSHVDAGSHADEQSAVADRIVDVLDEQFAHVEEQPPLPGSS